MVSYGVSVSSSFAAYKGAGLRVLQAKSFWRYLLPFGPRFNVSVVAGVKRTDVMPMQHQATCCISWHQSLAKKQQSTAVSISYLSDA
jgi:hypothetical protein